MSPIVKELFDKQVEELNKNGYRITFFDDMTDPGETVICVCLGNYHVQIPISEYLFSYSFKYIENKIALAMAFLNELAEENEKNEKQLWLHKEHKSYGLQI